MKLLTKLGESPAFTYIKFTLILVKKSVFILIGLVVFFFSKNLLQRFPKINLLIPLLFTSAILFITYALYKKIIRKTIQKRTEYEFKAKSQHFPKINPGKRTIEGINIHSLLEKYGSPLFVVSHQKIKEKYSIFDHLLQQSGLKYSIAYSIKTNNVSEICKTFKRLGAMAEVVSAAEYLFAKKLGYKDSNIIFNGPLKEREVLKKALKGGALVNIDNFQELQLVSKLSTDSKVNIGIRVNSTKTGLKSRFGFNIENGQARKACRQIARNKRLRLIGIHNHIGSNISDPRYYKLSTKAVCEFVKEIRKEYSIKLNYLDLGGGFPTIGSGASYSSLFSYPIERYIKEILHLVNKYRLGNIRLILEPGRFLVDEAIVLLASVINVASDGNRSLVTTDASINILPLAKSRSQLTTVIHAPKTLNNNHPTVSTTIYGASCIEEDCLIDNKAMPLTNPGDIIVFYNAGAYNISQSNQFIFPRPAIVMIKNNKVQAVRKKEKSLDIWRYDIVT